MAYNEIYLILHLALQHSDFSFSLANFFHVFYLFCLLCKHPWKEHGALSIATSRALLGLSEFQYNLLMLSGHHACGTFLLSLSPSSHSSILISDNLCFLYYFLCLNVTLLALIKTLLI